MDDDALTQDECNALEQIGRGLPPGRPSACVARNSQRLAGLKYIARNRKGVLELTEKARQLLFIRDCIAGLRALAENPTAQLSPDVLGFLEKKGHILRQADGGAYALTAKGRESLAGMDQTAG